METKRRALYSQSTEHWQYIKNLRLASQTKVESTSSASGTKFCTSQSKLIHPLLQQAVAAQAHRYENPMQLSRFTVAEQDQSQKLTVRAFRLLRCSSWLSAFSSSSSPSSSSSSLSVSARKSSSDAASSTLLSATPSACSVMLSTEMPSPCSLPAAVDRESSASPSC